jgi:hypothetical protein
MSEIFKINWEPNINYGSTTFNELKETLKNWRLNISEEIKCLIFLKSNIELKEDDSNDQEEQAQIDSNLKEQYIKIFNKLEELCLQEINLISETIVNIDEVSNNEQNLPNNESDNNRVNLYNKINLTLNNYNKIVENINETISSLSYLFNLYMMYIKYAEDEHNYIRENIKIEEEKFYEEKKIQKNRQKIEGGDKIKNKKKFFDNNFNDKNVPKLSKREKMIIFSKSLNGKQIKKRNKSNNNQNDIEQIQTQNNINRENLKDILYDTESIKDKLKDDIYSNCVKENEMKNFIKMKEDNKLLYDEMNNIKNSIAPLKDIYKSQLDKLNCLLNERKILEKENYQLCEYVNKILSEEENKIDIYDNDNNMNNKNDDEKNVETSGINISPLDFQSFEMYKRLNKL